MNLDEHFLGEVAEMLFAVVAKVGDVVETYHLCVLLCFILHHDD